MNIRFYASIMLCAGMTATSLPARATDFSIEDEKAKETEDFSEKATGGWGGSRRALEDAGITAYMAYVGDVQSNVSGGVERGTRALDNLDLAATFDGEKLLGVEGLSATLHLINNNGGRPNGDLVGSAGGVNNHEVPRATGKLYEAYLQQNYYDDRLSFLAGLYDMNTEFYVTDASSLFLQPSAGTGTDIAQSGRNGPSIFPFTAVGARVRVNPTKETYFQVAALDGVAGKVGYLSGTHVSLNRNDGLLMIGEGGYVLGDNKIGVGGWYYTKPSDDFIRISALGTPEKEHQRGAYVLGQHALYSESEGQGLVALAHIGIADSDVSRFDYAWYAGVVYTGLIPTRDAGRLGLALSSAHNGDAFYEAARASGAAVERAETVAELTYSDNITPWMALQPDVQYIMNPNTDPSLDDALVVAARVTIDF
jgi:porin